MIALFISLFAGLAAGQAFALAFFASLAICSLVWVARGSPPPSRVSPLFYVSALLISAACAPVWVLLFSFAYCIGHFFKTRIKPKKPAEVVETVPPASEITETATKYKLLSIDGKITAAENEIEQLLQLYKAEYNAEKRARLGIRIDRLGAQIDGLKAQKLKIIEKERGY